MWLAEIMCGEKMGGVVSSGLNELLEIVKLSCYKEYEHDTRAIL